jgi:hypothetical protein
MVTQSSLVVNIKNTVIKSTHKDTKITVEKNH